MTTPRMTLPTETAMATADYLAMMEDARIGQIARSLLQRLADGHDLNPQCEPGCGEMGICHRDLRRPVRDIAIAIGVTFPNEVQGGGPRE